MANQKLLEVLKDAIRAEVEGHSFYLMAAMTTTDSQGKEVFERLAREELDHAAFLRSQYDSLMTNGKVTDAKLGVPQVPAGSTIFSAELRDRISAANFEITALSIGAQLEQTAMTFYAKQANAAKDPAVTAIFQELEEWERGHYRLLTAELATLQQDFWSTNRFSPF